jgi:hypothetical protein
LVIVRVTFHGSVSPKAHGRVAPVSSPAAPDRQQPPPNQEDNSITPSVAIQPQTLISLATAWDFFREPPV